MTVRRPRRPLRGEQLEPRNLLALTAQLLADINPGSGESAAGLYEVVGNIAFFTADTGATGRELWKTDGTAAGTSLVSDIVPGPVESFPRSLTNVNGTLFFVVPDSATGEHFELWKSDGTTAGTIRVSDLDLGGIGATAAPELTVVGSTLFFRGADAAGGAELWKTDGTTDGTVLVSDIAAGSAGSDPRYLTNVGGTLFFRASSNPHGAELWRSDGTAAGTALLQDLGPANDAAGPKQLTNVNGTLYFAALGDVFSSSLWKSDGTVAGTVLLKDAGIGGITNIGGLTNAGGKLFFSATDEINGQELWTSDGTTAGTALVRDLNAAGGTHPWELTNVGGTLFFTGLLAGGQAVIAKSDGSAAGTAVVAREEGVFFTDVRGTLFFSDVHRLLATGGTPGELLEIVGAEGATSPTTLYEMANLNGTLLFTADDGIHGAELWSVVAVNEAPSFVKGPDQTATDSGGPKTIDNWATEISAGPFYESWQQLNFTVTAENPALFATPPAIDASGRLTFAPLPNASGSTLVTVVLNDNGGMAGGGIDAAPLQTFTITIVKPAPLQNSLQPLDTSGDGAIGTLDAVLIINWLNATPVAPSGNGVAAEGEAAALPAIYYDVSGDNRIAPLDAVLIINHLNASLVSDQANPADALPSTPGDDSLLALIDLLATDEAEHATRRRRR